MSAAWVALAVLLALAAALAVAARVAPAALTRLGLAAERRRSGLRLRHAVVDGFDMPYLEGGEGEPLLLIHGFAADKDNFTRIARFLTPHYRVLIPDLPGFGDAGRRDGADYHMATQARRLHDFLAGLGIARVHVGGSSMGGYIAAQMAGTWPDLVATVWLLDAAGVDASYDNDLLRHYEATGEMPLLIRSAGEFDHLLAATVHRKPFIPGFICRVLGERSARDFPLHTDIMQQLHASPTIDAQWPALPQPALIVWGREDGILSPRGAEAYRAIFPQSTVHILDRIGHLPMVEAPRRVASDYLAFRRRHSRAGGSP
ncbi:MAG: alpha/beta fold hydrolase [Telluria sp.]